MPRQTSTGTCTFCQGTFSKGTMTRHLSACKQRQAVPQDQATRGTGRQTTLFHLVADGYGPYWLHLEVRADARLDTLDTFLRNIWLECCGHMSQFCIVTTQPGTSGTRGVPKKTLLRAAIALCPCFFIVER